MSRPIGGEAAAGRPTHETAVGRTWYLRTAAETAGELHEQRVEHAPGSPFPPSHRHPSQDEHFEIEAGAMVFVVAGAERILRAGETIDIPRGTSHRARNASATDVAVVRWETRPALRSGEFFAAVARLGDGAGLLDAALLADEYRDVFQAAGSRRLVIPILAAIARLAGRRPPDPGP